MNWISVKDRLPEWDESIIVARKVWHGFVVEEGWRRCLDSKGYKYDTVTSKGHYDVTHWMPLPDPPEGE